MKSDEFKRTVRAAVHGEFERSGAIQRSQLVAQLASQFSDFDGPDRDAALVCVYDTITRLVKSELNAVRAQEDPRQQSLFGAAYKHLQATYAVERGGAIWHVRITKMTSAERQAKAREHRSQGAGHYEHAAEIEQFDLEFTAIHGTGDHLGWTHPHDQA